MDFFELTKSGNVFLCLARAAEGAKDTKPPGFEWLKVRLEAARPGDMTRSQFAGCLSLLKARGAYRPLGRGFGEVRVWFPAKLHRLADATQE